MKKIMGEFDAFRASPENQRKYGFTCSVEPERLPFKAGMPDRGYEEINNGYLPNSRKSS